MSRAVKEVNEADSDVSDLDQQQLGEAMVVDKWAPQLGYCEDPETPLTADTFPSKSGGKPVSVDVLVFFVYVFDVAYCTLKGMAEP